MADRVSTIRFKAEGLDDVSRDVKKYVSQFRSEMERANKLFSQADAGLMQGADPDAMKATTDKAVELYISAQSKMKAFEKASWEESQARQSQNRRSELEHYKIAAQNDAAIAK